MRKLLLCAAVALLAACTLPPPTTIDITNTNTNTQTGGGPGAGASPSPSPGSSVIARVGIGQFGERCPVGVAPSGDGRSSSVRVGCQAFLTVSAFSPAGEEFFDLTVIGTAPEVFDVTSGAQLVDVTTPSNPFNRDVTAKAVGTVTFTARIKGVTSAPYTLRVVQ